MGGKSSGHQDLKHPVPELKEAMGLTDYAVLSRYPGDLEPVTEKEYQEAVELAEKVIQLAETSIS